VSVKEKGLCHSAVGVLGRSLYHSFAFARLKSPLSKGGALPSSGAIVFEVRGSPKEMESGRNGAAYVTKTAGRVVQLVAS
jgi:hypothetical protein